MIQAQAFTDFSYLRISQMPTSMNRIPLLLILFLWLSLPALSQTSETPKRENIGQVESRLNNRVRVICDDLEKPPTGFRGTLYKYFEQKILGVNSTGWLEIAKVEASGNNPGDIYFDILEEKSEIVVNGEKVDHFKRGNKVKFIWEQGSAEFDREKDPD